MRSHLAIRISSLVDGSPLLIRKSAVAALLGVMCFVIVLSVAAVASADDFEPPPWDRTDPFALTAEWDFFTDDNPIVPDGGLTNVFGKGSGSAPGGTFASILGPVPPDDPFWGGNAWSFPDGGVIHIEMDNVIDLEPIKFLWLQVTHSPGTVLGLDPLPTFNSGVPSVPVITPFDLSHTLITWDLIPNPDWEEFDLLVLTPGDIDQIVLDTISVPEPSTFVMCVVGLLSLGFVVWRRRKRA